MNFDEMQRQLRENTATKLAAMPQNANLIRIEDFEFCGITMLMSLAASVGAYFGLSVTRSGDIAKVTVMSGKFKVEDYVNLKLEPETSGVRTVINRIIAGAPKDIEVRLKHWYETYYTIG